MKYGLVFDTETTGLMRTAGTPIHFQPRVIELAIVRFELSDEPGEEKIVEQYNTLFDPGFLINDEITRITGITRDDLEEKDSISKHLDRIQQIFDNVDCAIAHNYSFDHEMLELEFERYNRKFDFRRRRICTVEESEWLFGYRLNLQRLHDFLYNEPQEKWHRAMDDVMTTYRCVIAMRKRGWFPC